MDQYDALIGITVAAIVYVLAESGIGGVSEAYEDGSVSETIEEDQDAGTVPSGTDNPFNDYEEGGDSSVSDELVGGGDYGYDTEDGQHESVGRGSQDGWGL